MKRTITTQEELKKIPKVLDNFSLNKVTAAIFYDTRRLKESEKYPVKYRVTFMRNRLYYPSEIDLSVDEFKFQ